MNTPAPQSPTDYPAFPGHSMMAEFHLVKIYRLLREAAEASQPCPSNAWLAEQCGDIKETTASKYIRIIEEAGHITVLRQQANRIVRITATGRKTRPTALAREMVTPTKTRHPWRTDEAIYVEEHMDTKTPEEIAAYLERGIVSVKGKIYEIKDKRRRAGMEETLPGKGRFALRSGQTPSGSAAITSDRARSYRHRIFAHPKKCLWPTWDEDTPRALRANMSCDAPTVHDKPYCPEHCARAYRKNKDDDR